MTSAPPPKGPSAALNPEQMFGYTDLDPVSQVITVGAVLLYALFCAYGLAKFYKSQESWTGILREKENLPGSEAPTSFSRVAGAIGAYFLTGFFVIIGGFVISRLWFPPEHNALGETLGNLDEFIGASVALFAPYAFNQVSQIFGGWRIAAREGPKGPIGSKATGSAPEFDPNTAGL